MPLIPLSAHPQDAEETAEICVIGAGIAGLLLARRLAGRGRRVVVLESGGATLEPTAQALNEIDNPSGAYTRALTGRYRALGGSSVKWGGRMLPISRHEVSARDYLSLPGWPLDRSELDAYLPEIEKLFGIGPSSYEADLLDTVDRDGRLPRDDGNLTSRFAKCPSFRRSNVATLLARDIGALSSLRIWLDATVCGFQLDRVAGRVLSVEARSRAGRTLTVRADRFVFAAGTIETTRLLLWLDALSEHRAFADCRVLGRYFQDHLKVKVAEISRGDWLGTNRLFAYRFLESARRDLHLETTAAAQREDGAASAFAYVTMALSQSPLGIVKKIVQDVQKRDMDPRDWASLGRHVPFLARSAYWRWVRQQLLVPRHVGFDLQVWIEQLPDWSNQIRLSESRDSLAMPKVLLDWRPREADERTFRFAIARIEAYWARAGFDRTCPLSWTPAACDASRPIAPLAEACAHPSGTTRMGTDPCESVVAPDLACHAIPNLSIASASTFPTAGSANPTLTIMALALRLADHLMARHPEATQRATISA
ncbi:GMC oxidoreductase [Aureimonas sp. AU20]|uniref:GMC oxidoreductase n=1 Tax=Aureimonas sp. AU20 TaxID=1349819 RepID=UPI00071EF1F1|nr:GMC family oxidoreductase [Aureimonas sp. AU20]ALN74700.1 hypothetical protein M673_18435 [Aureimonas sp. AU20]